MHETIKHSADLRTISSFKLQPDIVYQRHSQKGQSIKTTRAEREAIKGVWARGKERQKVFIEAANSAILHVQLH